MNPDGGLLTVDPCLKWRGDFWGPPNLESKASDQMELCRMAVEDALIGVDLRIRFHVHSGKAAYVETVFRGAMIDEGGELGWAEGLRKRVVDEILDRALPPEFLP